MKKLILLAVPAMLVSCGPEQFTIEGTAHESLEGKTVYLRNDANEVVDSAVVANHAFAFTGTSEEQAMYSLSSGAFRTQIFLVNGVDAKVNMTETPTVVTDNGGLNDTYNAFIQDVTEVSKVIRAKDDSLRALGLPLDSIRPALQADMDNLFDKYRQCITDNKDNIVGAFVLGMTARSLYPEFEQLDSMMNVVKYAKNIKMLTSMHNSLRAVAATAEGQMFTDFSGLDAEGKEVKLSDFVGKGKFVLLDFWASWCGPCKAEIPNLMELYKKYNGDKFTVLGVNISDTKEKFLSAMEKEGIEYPQIFIPRDNKDNAAELYGISGIPHIMLFAPDGTIVKRGLRGQEMKDFVADQLK